MHEKRRGLDGLHLIRVHRCGRPLGLGAAGSPAGKPFHLAAFFAGPVPNWRRIRAFFQSLPAAAQAHPIRGAPAYLKRDGHCIQDDADATMRRVRAADPFALAPHLRLGFHNLSEGRKPPTATSRGDYARSSIVSHKTAAGWHHETMLRPGKGARDVRRLERIPPQ